MNTHHARLTVSDLCAMAPRESKWTVGLRLSGVMERQVLDMPRAYDDINPRCKVGQPRLVHRFTRATWSGCLIGQPCHAFPVVFRVFVTQGVIIATIRVT
jgi:hypothetical protein